MYLNSKINHSTNYYRKNKTNRKIVHKCMHCSYETTGPKSCLKAHIWSKHTPENERPFQCLHPGCCRGFAQKHNLQKHMEKIHNVKLDLKKNNNIAQYRVDVTGIKPTAKKTLTRIKYYETHPIIYPNELNISLNIDDKQIVIKQGHLYYDNRNGYITLKTVSHDNLHKRKKIKNIKLIVRAYSN